MQHIPLRTFLFLLLVSCSAAAPQSVQRYSRIGDLPLENNDTLYDCIVGYRTFGTLNADRSNAVLMCTWYMGTSADLAANIGPDKDIDSAHFFIIAVDALGDGVSSSPSNSSRQPGDRFPAITIGDMVESQYRMVRKEFGITQLYGVIGGSMGGMQVFEWAVAHPSFIRKAAATVATPRTGSYGRLTFSVLSSLIDDARTYNIPNAEVSRLYNMAFAIVLRTPGMIAREHPAEKGEEYLNSFRRNTITPERFLDLRRQLDAIMRHDVYRHHGGSVAETVKKLPAMFLIVGEKDLTIPPEEAIIFAEAAQCPILILSNDCGHLSPGCEHARSSAALRDFFARP